jgi:hypothetical protein
MRILSCFALTLAAAMLIPAQTGNRRVTDNKQSPPADTSTTLGGKKVTIEYNAPSVRGRKVEGGLVPYGNVWRLGADSATTLTTESDIMIGNLRVPAGVHTLYIHASPGGWKLAVNNQKGQWGTEYNEGQDLGRVDLKVTKLDQPVETLKITLQSTGSVTGTLIIEWGNTRATASLKAA